MKFRIISIVAAFFCCLSCIEIDYSLGGSLIPTEQTYSVHIGTAVIDGIEMQMADSLSGYSSNRITIGAIRDEVFGLTTRSSVVTLVPLADTLDFGTNPVVKKFRLAVGKDSTSVLRPGDEHILQSVRVYEMDKPLDPEKDFNINKAIPHSDRIVSSGTPVINGKDSLVISFSKEYASKYLDIKQEDLQDMEKYLKKFPGICLETNVPSGIGGRINMFGVQLGYDSSYGYLTGNFASLTVETRYSGWEKRRDTSFYFYLSPLEFYDLDSLLTNSGTGKFPEYAFNATGHESRGMAGKADKEVLIEGGGGLKPVIRAATLKKLANDIITAQGADPRDVVINKATIVLPFEFPEDYKDMDRFPYFLSPTCRIVTEKSTSFMNLTDSSNSSENQGSIDRSNLIFSPDITYHMQEMLALPDSKIEKGDYDIWFLIVANETITTSNQDSGSSDMNEYYQYLAYQSYYNNMYNGYGYGGYGGYGGYDYYNNYYSYMMMSQMYANQSTTTTTTQQMLDKDRYYYGHLNGPSSERAPYLELTFSVPKK